MKVIPFGEVVKNRLDISKQCDLVKRVSNVWILTQKCRDNYDPISYIEYLRGKLDKPQKKTAAVEKTEPVQKVQVSRDEALEQLLAL